MSHECCVHHDVCTAVHERGSVWGAEREKGREREIEAERERERRREERAGNGDKRSRVQILK